jgi:hypothetical protein
VGLPITAVTELTFTIRPVPRRAHYRDGCAREVEGRREVHGDDPVPVLHACVDRSCLEHNSRVVHEVVEATVLGDDLPDDPHTCLGVREVDLEDLYAVEFLGQPVCRAVVAAIHRDDPAPACGEPSADRGPDATGTARDDGYLRAVDRIRPHGGPPSVGAAAFATSMIA